MQALTRDISDHTPLLLDCGTSTNQGNQRPFQFELCWLLTNDFFEQVRDVWNNENNGTNSLQRWQFKIRQTRQYLRGWGRHVRGKNKQEKEDIKSMIDSLDKKAEYLQMS